MCIRDSFAAALRHHHRVLELRRQLAVGRDHRPFVVEDTDVGVAGTGPRLKAGMTITIEPMINLGGPDVRILDDEWTVVTTDGKLSAQFEHTVVVTKRGCEILTK